MIPHVFRLSPAAATIYSMVAFSFGCFFSTTVPSPSPSSYYSLALHVIFLLKIYFLQPI